MIKLGKNPNGYVVIDLKLPNFRGFCTNNLSQWLTVFRSFESNLKYESPYILYDYGIPSHVILMLNAANTRKKKKRRLRSEHICRKWNFPCIRTRSIHKRFSYFLSILCDFFQFSHFAWIRKAAKKCVI